MSLDAALSIANSGLSAINQQLALVSHNVANASTPGYAVEVAPQTTRDSGGQPMGVVVGVAQRQVDDALNASLSAQGGVVSGLQVTTAALSSVDTALGTVGQGDDLSSLQGTLQSAFSTLENDPSNQASQAVVVSAAQGLASGINALADTYTQQRQTAQDSIVNAVGQLNTDIANIGQISNEIIKVKASGGSTADLENQRDSLTQNVSQLANIKFIAQDNGDMIAVTSSGLSIPLHSTTPPFSTADAAIGATSSYPGSIPAITLNGRDVTTQLTGGQIGANVTLRDQTLPTFQAELDEYSHTLATRFQAQGLTLFTDPSGAVPTSTGAPVQSGYVGFSSTIQVNPAVSQTISLVRDGTAGTANTTGATGFTGVIDQVLNYTFGAKSALNTLQPTPNQTGLGPNGNLSAPYSSMTLGDMVSSMVASQSQASTDAQTQLTTEQAVQTTLQGKVSDVSGVSIDSEMSTMIQLQNAYSANAHVLTTVQSMWQALESAVQ
jgi:flagellar hook-associated protein 1